VSGKGWKKSKKGSGQGKLGDAGGNYCQRTRRPSSLSNKKNVVLSSLSDSENVGGEESKNIGTRRQYLTPGNLEKKGESTMT